MMNDALVQQLLHDADGCVSVGCLLVLDQPVNQFLSNKAVWVGTEMMSSVFDDLSLVKPESENITGKLCFKNVIKLY